MKQTKTPIVTIVHIQITTVSETEENIACYLTHTHVDEHSNKKYHKRLNGVSHVKAK
jgi:hypothetical protein